ncbi:MAG TPA: hypothetical protein VLE53_12910 [Gemmatimonadaceae bacterium]|nr:hypothetical protein [Gemmatimonadaceae bacterium]
MFPMLRRGLVAASAVALAACASPESVSGPPNADLTAAAMDVSARGGRAGTSGVVYVVSQGLYYDTFVSRDPLPFRGRFQLIANGQTQFGPGDPGYLGGRWWEDTNANGIQDATDHYFLCPLLGPGRPTP